MQCNAIFLCFVAMMATGRAHEWAKNTLTSVRCNNITQDRLRNAIILDSHCNLKEVLLILAPPNVYEAVEPGVAWVKRCVGDCDTSPQGFTCRPHDTERRNIPITLYNVKTNQQICSTYTVEDHLSCRCEGANTTCVPTGASVPLDLAHSSMKNPALVPTSVWFKRCAGKCAEYDKRCVPQSAIIKQVVTGRGIYNAEEHNSCGCAPEEFIGHCEAVMTFVSISHHMSPLVKVRQCRGHCLNPGYQCTPVKTKIITFPQNGRRFLEHHDCLCAQLLDLK